MVVLDIDMDYFQTGIHTDDIDSERYLNDDSIQVWSQHDFISFLHNQCKLSRENRVPGRIVKHHVEAYYYWNYLIQKGQLDHPFKVIHIDAHSDLGFSINLPFYKFLKSLDSKDCNEYLAGNLFKSSEYKKYINSGNYLLCSVMDNLVNRIDYVYHDKLESLDATKDVVECIEAGKSFRFNFSQKVLQQDVHLNLISKNQFSISEPVDFITVAISPSFVKEEIWCLINILKDYIDLDILSI
ncbi:MAG: hypothetical protein ACQGTM_11935 [bacterium]